MQNLREQRAWSVFSSDGRGEGKYTQPNGEPAVATEPATLVTWQEAADYMHHLHHRAGEPYPMPYALAVSLDAAGLICVSLLDCFDEDTGLMEGAARWAGALDSYTEKCWRGMDGTSVRILCRGQLPEGAVPPPKVQIQTTGFCTLTGQRIAPRPAWQGDNNGVIRDCTGALEYLLLPKKTQYISI